MPTDDPIVGGHGIQAHAQNCRGLSVWARLDRMQWGGEYLPVPCAFAHGLVIGCEDVEEEGDPDAPVVWIVDFAAQFGVQRIQMSDCEVIQPPTQRQDHEGHGEAPYVGAAAWAPMGEGAAANLVQYHWSRRRGRGRGGGRGGQGAAATEGQGAAIEGGRGGVLRGARGQRRSRGGRGIRGTCVQRPKLTILDPVSDNNNAEEDWEPTGLNAGSVRDDTSLSDGDSSAIDDEREAASLMLELGEYPHGPWPDEDFAVKYREENWHAKTWEMHPRQAFCGPDPGPKHGIEDFHMAPVDYFKLLWTETIQTRIVQESNKYARTIDPRIGIAVQGCQQDVCVSDRFEHIKRCLHLVDNSTYVTDMTDPRWICLGRLGGS
jgi:hypothetical protein